MFYVYVENAMLMFYAYVGNAVLMFYVYVLCIVAIKQGRYTHERRTQYINEVKSKCDKKTEPITDNSEACRLVNNLMVVQQKYMTHKDVSQLYYIVKFCVVLLSTELYKIS